MTVLIADCETNGLLDDLSTIHCIAFVDADTGVTSSFADQPGHRPIREGLDLLAAADVTVWHNGIKFDIPAIRKVYPEWSPRGVVRDSMLTASLVYPKNPSLFEIDKKLGRKGIELGRLVGSHSLEAWGLRLGKWKGDYATDKAAEAKALGSTDKDAISRHVWGSWNQEMHDYCEQDVAVTLALWKKLTKELETWRSQECVDLEHEVAWIIARQERRGVCFNREDAEKLVGELTAKHAALAESLRSIFPPKTIKVPFVPARDNKTKGWKKGVTVFKEKVVEFKPTSRDHIAERLIEKYGWQPTERTKGGKWKIDDDVLSELPYPEAQQLAELFMLDKRLGTLANGKGAFIKAINKRTGRIHHRCNSNGAVTGRATHSDPNMNLPKVKKAGKEILMGQAGGYGYEIRSLIRAGPGMTLVGTDADSLEARVEAGFTVKYDDGAYRETILSGDKAKGTDLHTRNMLAIKPIEASITRDTAKNTKYAWTYGAADWKLGATAGATGSREAVSAKGAKIRKRLLAASPGLKGLVEAVEKSLKQRPYLWGLDGRKLAIRAKHAAVNTLFQSAGSIIFKKAMVLRDQTLTGSLPSQIGAGTCEVLHLVPGIDFEQVLWVHDEVQVECRPEIADEVGQAMADAIRDAGEHFKFNCPMGGNSDVGPHWAATH